MATRTSGMPMDAADAERHKLEDKISCHLVDNWGTRYTADEIMDYLNRFKDEPWCAFIKTRHAKRILTEKLEDMAKWKIRGENRIDEATGTIVRYYYTPNMTPPKIDL